MQMSSCLEVASPWGQALADLPTPSLLGRCLHYCSSILQGGDAGEETSASTAAPCRPVYESLVWILWKRLLSRCAYNLFQAEMAVSLLSRVELWSFCVVSDGNFFPPANFSFLLPSALPSPFYRYLQERCQTKSNPGFSTGQLAVLDELLAFSVPQLSHWLSED